jgi:radical SAM superfamily enzyme YgiQ (UPF0313 family)
MNILLVYPTFPKSFWSFGYALQIYGRKALLPPLGLLTVAAMLPKEWNKRLVDLNVSALTDEDLAWADYVFLSGMAVQRIAAHDVARRCKAAGKTMIAGGPLFAGEYALFPEISHFVLSEGETTMAKVVADMQAGTLKRLYRCREFADMTTSPVPLFELLDISQYACMAIQYTRGCPFDCEFCNVTALLGRQPRIKKSEQIIAELDAMKAAGWRNTVFFVDDNLIGNRPALKNDLLPALIAWQKRSGPIPFLTQASINLADDQQLMDMMNEAGFDTVFVGIETSDPEALKECSKSQNRNRNLVEEVRKINASGIEVQGGFIVGFDHDTEASFQQQADFIQASGIVTAMVGQLQAPPGTRLVSRMWLEGRLRGHSTGNNTDGTTNIIPKMGLEKLHEGYLWLLGAIFAPKPAYTRIRTFLRQYRSPRVQPPLDRRAIGCFLRSVYYLGIIGRERWEYWKLLVWTLCRHPVHFPSAVRLAALAHHYRRIWEEMAARPLTEPLHLVDEMQKAQAAGLNGVDLTVSARTSEAV